mmetsp:Transcript_44827/g.100682  ORF Transcript_44827/g.100682 Transcript_44827/m.100682 type:complete len:207 (+) Transcript_44827:38-658(+)|eukprot:CAMPEP_0197914758 /NCGR_PEP_ID=MMETSP1439-20131203/79037_1 /TAXON_ID=66791 /ORGANISM="Gonyaulax spinifera, Strain CCMP409" /LENGTH=206 /DNA_ID=CAMNT_0043536685 /DNA_START=38 /DNA_END=658 /DNA_ORIENTATION=-
MKRRAEELEGSPHEGSVPAAGAAATLDGAESKATAPDATASPSAPMPLIRCLNHVSRETRQVERMARFYREVLGFTPIPRPAFGFGGAWLAFPGSPGLQLHLIEADEGASLVEGSRRDPASGRLVEQAAEALTRPVGIRRGHHIALEMAATPEEFSAHLKRHGVEHHVFEAPVPGTTITQIFFYDPDGNGVEVGDFGAGQASRAGQ